jgi:3-hydroxybutyryl-CoA dehydrogenase
MSISRVAVIGAGTMGHGIAQLFALAGLDVWVTDAAPDVLDAAQARIARNLETCVAHGFAGRDQAAAALGRIRTVPDIASAVSAAEYVVEAIVEQMAAKHEVLAEAERHCQDEAIITSTTSSFRAGELATSLAHPGRFLVTHFWNPPYLIPVVEVVPGEATSPAALQASVELLERVGKRPVVVQQDVAGFIGNRLQHALRREAVAIVAQGIASPQDVDLVARYSFGLRLPVVGPLETADLGGLDLTVAIQEYLLPQLDRSTEPLPLVRAKVDGGELGAKTGQGFFDWPPGRVEQRIEQRDRALMEILTWLAEYP